VDTLGVCLRRVLFFKASFFLLHQVNLGGCVVGLFGLVGGRFVAVVRGFLTM